MSRSVRVAVSASLAMMMSITILLGVLVLQGVQMRSALDQTRADLAQISAIALRSGTTTGPTQDIQLIRFDPGTYDQAAPATLDTVVLSLADIEAILTNIQDAAWAIDSSVKTPDGHTSSLWPLAYRTCGNTQDLASEPC